MDCAWLLDRYDLKAPQVERRAGWVRLSDAAFDYGVSHAPVVEQGIEPPWEG